MEILVFIATLSIGLYAGGAYFSTTVSHPARLICTSEQALAHFNGEHKYVEFCLPIFLVLGIFTNAAYWYLTGMTDIFLMVIIIALVFIVPFSIIIVQPILNKLMDKNPEFKEGEIRTLLQRWTKLNLVRTVIGCLAFIYLLWIRII